MQWVKRIPPVGLIPSGWGLYRLDYSTNSALLMPIPINLLRRAWMVSCHRLAIPFWMCRDIERLQEEAYRKGCRDTARNAAG